MKTDSLYIRRIFLVLMFCLCYFSINAQTTTFVYQGRIVDGYNLTPTGQYDLQYNLYDQLNGTNSPLNISPLVVEDVNVVNGVFVVMLDFGNLFSGADRFMEIGTRMSTSTGTFTILTPRQQITSEPYSIRSLTSGTANLAINSLNLNGFPQTSFVFTSDSRLFDARTPTAGSSNYIQNSITQQPLSNFNVSGNGTIGGNLFVNGFLNGNGSNLTNLNAVAITSGTLDNARLPMVQFQQQNWLIIQ
jgi:hypothetical protein